MPRRNSRAAEGDRETRRPRGNTTADIQDRFPHQALRRSAICARAWTRIGNRSRRQSPHPVSVKPNRL